MSETTIEITYSEVIDFFNGAQEYLNNPERKPTSLSYALDRMVKRVRPLVEDFQSKVADLQEKYQYKDKDGVLLSHPNGQPKFTAENHAAFRKEHTALRNSIIEVTPFLATKVPQDLEVAWYTMFVPFVIAEFPQGE